MARTKVLRYLEKSLYDLKNDKLAQRKKIVFTVSRAIKTS